MLKTVLFTHTDLDGAGCAVIFNLIMKTQDVQFSVIHCHNNTIDAEVQKAWDNGVIDKETHICFGDICPSTEMAKKLAENFPVTIRIWDHHTSNLNITNIIYTATVLPADPQGKLTCGTSIMYDFFTNVPSWNQYLYNMDLLKEFVETVRSYDTYDWKKDNNKTAQQLDALFRILGMDRFVDRYIKKMMNNANIFSIGDDHSDDSLIDEQDFEYINARLEEEQRYINSVTIDNVQVIDIKGLKAAVRFSGGASINEIADQFLAKYPNIDVFIDLNIGGGTYSFRTRRDDLNTAEVLASPIGGGGHPKASGAPMPKELRDNVLNLLVSHVNSD